MNHRPFGRARAALGLAGAAVLVPPWLLMHPASSPAKALERGFHRAIAAGFGLRPQVRGTPGAAGTMLVANHISWADIISVAAVVDTDFVSKADVAAYPGLGALAARTGTIFVERERRSQAVSQMETIRARLRAGRRVLMFPEGTTSDGRGLLPFRSSLFAAADAAVAVQPVTIRYTAPGGGPLDPAVLDAIAWIGDEDMLPNALGLARQRVGVLLHFHEPVAASAFDTRKALAEHCRDIMLRHYRA
ncbi:lysophospholipid acyltransferase family protein [Sphingosinicella soli]|uniref:1-acyl-sn-glycerol-3-phosphate acyltransferase n=1 Tax=Sphingosinicella soli TaxID=333708 RepID=A0A7W7B3D1_9SPHN|nr:lysophospholipid acyltransferase family protein [Sphingosinicella soli]MBB4632343.1 1-acyl-sn-glycerol-3-phosphate acyltransferase [Sphingosinicella soli]